MAATRVLYLVDYTELGGGETSFVEFLRAAGRRENALEPSVVLRGEGTLAEAVRGVGVEPVLVDYPMRLRRGILPATGYLEKARIEAEIGRRGPAIVHANNFFGMVFGGAAARRRKVPLVWTCHGWWELDKPIKRLMAQRNARRVLCVSGAVKAEADRLTNGKLKTSVDYLGISEFVAGERGEGRRATRRGVRDEMRVAEDVKVLGVVGRFQPVKGHALLFEALPELLKAFPKLMVWLIGDSILDDAEDVREQARVRGIVRSNGWESRVEFLGWRKDARRLMRGMDALVVPSHRESFSMAAVEGLEAGVPVVGPDNSGPAEIIDPPATGALFQSGNAAHLASQLIKVLEGESGFDRDAGPRRVRELFSVEAHVDRVLAVYRELL